MNSNDKRDRVQREQAQLREALEQFAVAANNELSLAQRTRQRLRRWEQLRQHNLESIAREALSYLAEGGKAPDTDWLAHFLELAAEIHSAPLRSLWARILVAESSRPGSFSLQTLQRLRQLTQRDASALRQALALRCRLGESGGLQILSGWGVPLPWWQALSQRRADTSLPLARYGLPPSTILALEELGLLFNEEFGAGPFHPDDEIPLTIGNQRWLLVPRKPGTRLTYLRFTAVGEELAQLIQTPSHSTYLHELSDVLAVAFELRDHSLHSS